MPTVLVSDAKTTDLDTERAALADAGLDDVTVRHVVAHDEARLREAAADADALIVDANTPVTAAVLEALDLRVVGRAGVGVDNVALEAAAAAGTTVVNVPDYCRDEVATHALALLLGGARGLSEYAAATRRGEWDWTAGRPVSRVPGSTLGLYGFGAIARRLTELAAGYDLEVIAHDPYVDADAMARSGVERVGFEGLLARSDLLSLHAPATAETRGRFDREAFDALSRGPSSSTPPAGPSSTSTPSSRPSTTGPSFGRASTCCRPSPRPTSA